jgi:hypothetical protein
VTGEKVDEEVEMESLIEVHPRLVPSSTAHPETFPEK